jgi:hypothetical protein
MVGERRKITVGLLFGGRSAEHDVSRVSAANILRALNPDDLRFLSLAYPRMVAGLSAMPVMAGGRALLSSRFLTMHRKSRLSREVEAASYCVIVTDQKAVKQSGSMLCSRSCTGRTEKTGQCKEHLNWQMCHSLVHR